METNDYKFTDTYVNVLDSVFVGPGAEIVRSGDFSIFYMNIRGITNKFNELLSLLKSFKRLPDCIVLVETWLRPDIAPYFNISDYNSHHLFRTDKRGGGISVFVSNAISQVRVEHSDVADVDLEMLKIVLRTGKLKYNLFSIYRPPCGDVNSFLSKIELNITSNSQANNILVGDFNIDLLNRAHFGSTSNLKALLVSAGYALCINRVTRPKASSISEGTLIDHIWTNFRMTRPLASVIDYQLSDHFPLSLSFSLNDNTHNNTKSKIKFRQIDDSTIDRFKRALDDSEFDCSVVEGDVSVKWKRFDSFLNEHFDRCCPVKTKITRHRDKAPWFNREIKSLISQKHSMYKLLINGVVSKTVYKQFCNKVTSCIRKRKNSYYANLYSNQHCSKKKWDVLKQHIGQFKSHKTINEIKCGSGEVTTDHALIASVFNKHFSTIGDQIAESIPASDSDFEQFLNAPNPHSFYFFPTTPSEVARIISSLKSSAPRHMDEIPIRLLKKMKDAISPLLSELINESVESGVVPDDLKIAKVIPLYKGGDHLLPNNFRPISLLPAMSKIFEKVMHSRVSSFLETFNRLNQFQFGLRYRRNTSSALQVILQNIYTSLEAKQFSANIYLDFSKAFDSVSHDIIIRKLEHHGVRGNSLKWFKNYLTNRKQFVSLGDQQSALCSVNRGVPQGSILGPLLFIIMINDLFNCHNVGMVSYADDTTLMVSSPSTSDLHNRITSALKAVCRWTNANELKLNLSKTKFTIFTNKAFKNFEPIYVNDQLVQHCNEYKILGLTLDSSLSFRSHIHRICRRLSFCSHVLRRIGGGVGVGVRRIIYNSFADTHIRYCLEFYGSTFGKYTSHLRKRQKLLVRQVAGASTKASCYGDMSRSLNLFTYDTLLRYKISCIVHELISLDRSHPLAGNLSKISSAYNLRNQENLGLPLIRLSKTKHSILWQGPKIWNSIPLNIRHLPSQLFKKRLRSHLLSSM